MVLVNGAEGIGTGWMTKIPNHNPREIIDNLLRMLKGDEPLPMVSIDGDKFSFPGSSVELRFSYSQLNSPFLE